LSFGCGIKHIHALPDRNDKQNHMHCEKCWQFTEDAKELQHKSNQKLCDWSTLLMDIPDNLSKICDRGIRELVLDILQNMPSDRFPFQEWWEFLNSSTFYHGIEFTNLALEKMEETAETEEEKQSYRNVANCIDKKFN